MAILGTARRVHTAKQIAGRALGRLLTPAILCVLASGVLGRGQVSEYAAKAGFLLKFTQYVEWPSDAFATPEDPFEIGIFGSDPFGHKVDDAFQGVRIKNRPVVIKRVKNGADLTRFHILFVPAAQAGYAMDIARQTKGRPVLVVGESANFCKTAGVINFFLEKSSIRFEISSVLARSGNLTISSRLLSVARIIQ